MIIAPNLFESLFKKHSVYIGKKSKVSDFLKKIKRIISRNYYLDRNILELLENGFDVRANKLSDKINLDLLRNNYINKKKSDTIKLEDSIQLNNSTFIEDCEISDQAVILIEFKFEESWSFQVADKILAKCNYCKSSNSSLSFCPCNQVKYIFINIILFILKCINFKLNKATLNDIKICFIF